MRARTSVPQHRTRVKTFCGCAHTHYHFHACEPCTSGLNNQALGFVWGIHSNILSTCLFSADQQILQRMEIYLRAPTGNLWKGRSAVGAKDLQVSPSADGERGQILQAEVL